MLTTALTWPFVVTGRFVSDMLLDVDITVSVVYRGFEVSPVDVMQQGKLK